MDSQRSTARITGALAHELNNPLQGIFSLLSVLSREHAGDESTQVRLEQIRSGLTRLSRILESFSVAYENMPRLPDQTSLGKFLDHLTLSFTERQMRITIESEFERETPLFCMSPELSRLISDAFSLPSLEDRGVRLTITTTDDAVTLICERGEHSPDGNGWMQLDRYDAMSGVAGLINEITRLGGGSADFRFNDLTLCGIRLILRTQMSPA